MFSELVSCRINSWKLYFLCLGLIVIMGVSWVGSSSVTLNITGLPANVPAAVTLERNEGGVRLYLDSGTSIDNLPSGNYQTTVIPVISNGLNYNPQASKIPFFLPENQNLTLTINYLQDNTVVRNPAVIQSAIERSLPIHAVNGTNGQVAPQATTQQVLQGTNNFPQNFQGEGRSFLSNSNLSNSSGLSSSGIPGVRPLPFALNNNSMTQPTSPTTSNYGYPAQLPLVQNLVFPTPPQQNPVYQNPAPQQPSIGLPFQLPPFTNLFSNFGSYEWQAAQRPEQPAQQPVQTQPTNPVNTTLPTQQPVQPAAPSQLNSPNTYYYTRPNPLLPPAAINQPIQGQPIQGQPIQTQPIPTQPIPNPQTPVNQQPYQTPPTGNNSGGNVITGKVWKDQNRNRGFEPFESTVEGMRIYLDFNNNNQLDANEPSTLTNPSGVYEFSNLGAGTYKVSQEMPVGWSNLYAGPAQQLGFAPQVIGGWDASIDDFPFMTALVLNQTVTRNNGERLAVGTRWCGATLISSRWLITAAHCVHPTQNNLGFTLRPEMIGIISNQDYIPSQGINPNSLVGVRRVITHPSFQGATYRNDIALLELNQPLPQSRALLPNRNTAQQLTQVGNSGTVLGWGSTTAPTSAGNALQFSNQLQQTSLPFINNNRCNQMLDGIFVSSDMLCAGLPQGGRDACLGDSGGPLLTKVQNSWALVGIVSFGEGCAEPGKPGVYTNLGNYFDSFINRYVLPEKSQSHPVTFSSNASGQQQNVNFANFR